MALNFRDDNVKEKTVASRDSPVFGLTCAADAAILITPFGDSCARTGCGFAWRLQYIYARGVRTPLLLY